MLKKNGFIFGVLALLLSFGMVGSAFASDRNYIELDDSDYGEINSGVETNSGQTNSAVNAEVVQSETQASSATGWVNLIELDETDYNEGQYGFDANQTHRPVQATVAQAAILEPSLYGWVNLIELDESDYEYATPGNASKRVLCAGTGSTGQMNGC